MFPNKIANYLKFTDKATTAIANLITEEQKTSSIDGIKISLKTRGCSGLEYDLQFAIYNPTDPSKSNISKFDDLINITHNNQSFNIFIDGKFALYIIGTTMDYQETDTNSGFQFINPNEAGKCGCGESFTVKS